MNATLTMNDCAEALYYVYMLPRKVKVITNCGPLFSALKLTDGIHDVSFASHPSRRRLQHSVVYIVGSNMPYMYEPDVVVNRMVNRTPRSKLFAGNDDLFKYVREHVNPGAILATQDEELLRTLGSLRNDIWVTANMNNPLAIPIVVGSPLVTDIMEVKWYVLRR